MAAAVSLRDRLARALAGMIAAHDWRIFDHLPERVEAARVDKAAAEAVDLLARMTESPDRFGSQLDPAAIDGDMLAAALVARFTLGGAH